MLDINFSNKMILEGEIKDAKMSSFSSDFKTFIKHFKISIVFSSWIINEFEKCCLKTQSHTDQLHVDMYKTAKNMDWTPPFY